MAVAGLATARAQDAPPERQEAATYLLDVRVNGWALGLVARFVEQDGRLRIPAEQFDGLGFVPVEDQVATIAGERWVWLDRVAGLEWTIDQRNQLIDFRAPAAALKTTELRVAPGTAPIDARADWGAMLAWDAFGQWSLKKNDPFFTRSFSVNLDTRLFSPIFTAVSRGTVIGGGDTDTRFIRLESYLDFDRPGRSWRIRVGDSFTQGPIWVRPLRFGGVQWARDFALRPDIVPMPVPVLNQDISAPSTVDLFVNGVHRYSDSVHPGPLRLSDLPIVAGSNSIRAVITDSSGRRSEVILPFYASSQLLAKGVTDFSFEAGFPRQNYNVASNDYGGFFASGMLARGISDGLTLRGYAAAAKDYWTAIGGATAGLGVALVDGALFYSRASGESGWAFYAAASRTTPRFNIAASYVRSFGYVDLATTAGYSRIVERATGSLGVNLGRAGQVNLVYARQRTPSNHLTNVVSGSYGLDVGRRPQFHLSASGFADTSSGEWGAFLSVAFPLGARTQAYVQQGWRNGQPSAEAQLQGQGFDNRLDWQLDGSWQDQGYVVDAYARWEGAKADLFARATRVNDSTGLQAEIAQSLVWMDGRMFLSGRIDDGFTVVDVPDSPGVRVALENRTIGRTDRSGHILLADLQSWLPNAVSIDPLDLPLDAGIADTSLLVAPRGEAGMVTRFAVSRSRSAVVVLALPDGTPPPAGAIVQLADSDFAEPIGFGGEIYVRGLRSGRNRLDLRWRDGRCSAGFTADVIEGTLPRLGPYTCAP